MTPELKPAVPADFPTARLDVDLSALAHNFRMLQSYAPKAEVAPVVKADAYGLGMARVAERLVQEGAKTFFVARLEEGLTLRRSLGPEPVIYVLDGLGLNQETTFASHVLRPVLNHTDQYARWLSCEGHIKAALHIDTGMNRLGLKCEDIQNLDVPRRPSLTLLISHLACGDERDHPLNHQQLISFRAASDALNIPKCMSNSAGTFLGDSYHFDVIRPGISLYGGGPFGVPHPDILPVATVSARILQVRSLAAGDSVGYGATFIAPSSMTLATLGMGYADGLLRSLGARGSVWIAGQRRPILGRVSMDVISVDVTDLDVHEGDWAEIVGPNQNLDLVAASAGTIGYELLTRLGSRLQRRYINA